MIFPFQIPLEALLRWIELLSLLIIGGGLGFGLLVTGPVFSRVNNNEAIRQLGLRFDSRIYRLIWLSVGVALAGFIARLIFQAAFAPGITRQDSILSSVFAFLTGSHEGSLWLWRVAFLLAVALTLTAESIVLSKFEKNSKPWANSKKIFRTFALAMSMGMLLTLSLTGHLAAVEDMSPAGIISDYFHLLAAGFWVGGLFHFALGMPLFMRTLSAADRRIALPPLISRFSTLATLSVGTLMITGFFNIWIQFTDTAALITPYGLALLVKLVLLLSLFCLGSFRRLWLIPVLKEERSAQRIHKILNLEVAVAALVILSVGMLASLEAPEQLAVAPPATKKHPLGFYVGITGFALLFIALITGLLIFKRKAKIPLSYHRDIAYIGLGAGILHSIFATIDRFFPVP